MSMLDGVRGRLSRILVMLGAGLVLTAPLASGTTDGWQDGIPNSPSCQPNSDCGGMPVYQFQAAGCTLRLQDTPLWFSPAVGPKVQFHLSYNQMETLQAQTFTHWNLGPKWTSDWLAYVQDDSANPGQNVSIFQRGGGTLNYSSFNAATGAFAPNADVPDQLVKTAATSYIRTLPDGSQEVYSLPNGAISPRWIFLTAIVDPAGNTLTLTYDASFRLVTVTDALGQVTTLSYGMSADPLKVTQVADPFGRKATFTYAAVPDLPGYWSVYKHLESITDMGGLTSSFTYFGPGSAGFNLVAGAVKNPLVSATKSATVATATDPSSTVADCRIALAASVRSARGQVQAKISSLSVQAISQDTVPSCRGQGRCSSLRRG